MFFVTGFKLAFDPKYSEAIQKHRYITLVLGIMTTSVMFFFPIDISGLGKFLEYTLNILARVLNSWFWLVAFLGFGARYLSFSNGFLKYSREAVLPFYILHQTIIITIGFYIAQWDIGVGAKYAFLTSVSFVTIMAIYHLLVKRVRVLRFLFGMKAKA